MDSTIRQVHINQVLIRNAGLLGLLFEILDCAYIQVNGNLLF